MENEHKFHTTDGISTAHFEGAASGAQHGRNGQLAGTDTGERIMIDPDFAAGYMPAYLAAKRARIASESEPGTGRLRKIVNKLTSR